MTSAARPKQPVARRFHLVKFEISDLAVDERLGDGRHKRQKLGVGDDGAAAEIVQVTKAEFQIVRKQRLLDHGSHARQ